MSASFNSRISHASVCTIAVSTTILSTRYLIEMHDIVLGSAFMVASIVMLFTLTYKHS